MADSSSGRNSMNNGSDSAKHFTGTAAEQHERTPKAGPAAPVTGKQSNGYVGNDKPGAGDSRSAVRS